MVIAIGASLLCSVAYEARLMKLTADGTPNRNTFEPLNAAGESAEMPTSGIPAAWRIGCETPSKVSWPPRTATTFFSDIWRAHCAETFESAFALQITTPIG